MAAFVGDDTPVYLLAVLSKGDREKFSAAEIAQLKKVTTLIKQAAREASGR